MDEKELSGEPMRKPMPVQVWRCEDLKALIHRHVEAHVKDVSLAQRLEHALADEIAYGTGGGGNVGVA